MPASHSATSPRTRFSCATTRRWPSPWPRRPGPSSARWPPWAGTCCSGPAAPTSAVARRSPATKREPGSGCAARGELDRGHAVLGTSESCVATYPGDWVVALVALDATLWLPEVTVQALRTYEARQATTRLRASAVWQSADLVFCTPVGTPLAARPVRRASKKLPAAAGLGQNWTPRELRTSL